MARKTRTKSVPADAFIKGWIAGCKAGKTLEEIAADLNMQVESVRSRASQYRSENDRFPFPEGAGRTKVDVASLIDDVLGDDDDDDAADELDD